MLEFGGTRPQLVRAFAAVPVAAPAVVAALAEAQVQLRRTGAAVKWVAPGQFHFTLKFLGEIGADRVNAARGALLRATAAVEPFSLALQGLGAFPRPEVARVIWAGCGAGGPELVQVVRRVEAEMLAAGFPAERRAFSPHLTLGRVRDGGDPGPLGALLQAGAEQGFGVVPVTAVVLYRSELRPEGPVYTPLAKYPLGAGADQR